MNFKIPTLLGLGLILAGIASGVYLILKDQGFLTRASPNLTVQNITISNVEDTKVVVSYQTSSETTSFITYGIKNSGDFTALDDRDSNISSVRLIHYATLKNLTPDTNYIFKIKYGRFQTGEKNFKTAKSGGMQNNFEPIIGTGLDNGVPLNDGIVFLSVSGAAIQSSTIKSSGNFLIPISLMRKEDLSGIFQPDEDQVAKLTIVTDSGQATALFKIKEGGIQLLPINLGQNLDLTTEGKQVDQTDKFDLNGDGKINAADNAIILQNFGIPAAESKNSEADLNRDGVIDTEDLNLMSKQINQ